MKKMLFLLLTCTLVACAKIKTPTEESKLLFGKWLLVGTSGGFSGGGKGPLTEEETVEFKETGIAIFKVDGKVERRVHFTLKIDKSITGHEVVFIDYAGGGIDQSMSVDASKLYLSDEAYDGFQYAYVRQ